MRSSAPGMAGGILLVCLSGVIFVGAAVTDPLAFPNPDWEEMPKSIQEKQREKSKLCHAFMAGAGALGVLGAAGTVYSMIRRKRTGTGDGSHDKAGD